jgi:SSS family solute:Na+ symporter
VPRAPKFLGWLGILVNVLLYGYLYLFQSSIPFLNRMAICFGVVFAVMMLITLIKPLKEPVVMPTTDLIALESSKTAKIWGVIVVISTAVLYLIFW